MFLWGFSELFRGRGWPLAYWTVDSLGKSNVAVTRSLQCGIKCVLSYDFVPSSKYTSVASVNDSLPSLTPHAPSKAHRNQFYEFRTPDVTMTSRSII